MTEEGFIGGSSFTTPEEDNKELISPPNSPLPNKIKSNIQVCSVVHAEEFLNDNQCDAILKSTVDELWVDGGVEGNIQGKKGTKSIRSCKQQGLPMTTEGWPYTYILDIIQQANKMKYSFDLSGFMNYDSPMVIKYKNKDHYDWHIDVGKDYSNRKLSFIIQLSDSDEYEGGDIEFLGMITKTEEFRKKGTIIIFPSFLGHRITPIKKGVRHAIVGWVHGPTFV